MDLDRTSVAAPDFSQYSPKWQFRFNFFERYGAPNSPENKAALKAVGFGERVKIGINFWALFFGAIYFFVLGMWRKALTLIGVSLLLMLVAAFLPEAVGRGIGIAYSLFVAMAANYSYYLDRIKGSKSWNPWEGLRWS